MNVRVAMQTLRSTTTFALRNFYDTVTHRTAEFCDMMNSFFYMLNIRNNEHITKLNSYLKLFTSTDDERLDWLQSTFLEYFVKLKDGINGHTENFSKRERKDVHIYSNIQRHANYNIFNERINVSS